MSEKYMPFDYNSTAPDPSVYEYTATDERIFNLSNFTNGVFPETKFVESGNIVTSTYLGGSLAVTAGEGLSVSVSPGVAMVEGVKYWNSETKNIAFEQNNVEQVFDIVVELDTINQRVLTKKKIRTSGIAVTEDLLRSDSIYQLAIATVAIPANAAAITAAMITDQRLNTNLCADGKPVCGLVGAVSQLDFSVLYNQIMDWFDHLKGNLSEDAALNLQTQVDALKGSFAHSKSGAIHTLTGSFPVSTGITAIKFKATAGYTAGDTFTVNGTAYTASMQGGDALDKDAFISGDVVQVGADVDAKKLVFKGGGSPVLDGTATAAYVASGLTFYSTDPKTKLTGTGAAAKRFASGSKTLTISSSHEDATLTVDGLNFLPSKVFIHYGTPAYQNSWGMGMYSDAFSYFFSAYTSRSDYRSGIEKYFGGFSAAVFATDMQGQSVTFYYDAFE